jgi:chromosome segregation ATPase
VQQSQALQTELDATRTKLEFAMREAETRAAEDDTAQVRICFSCISPAPFESNSSVCELEQTAAQVNARRLRETHARELADAKEQIQQLTTFVQKHDQEAKSALAAVRTAKEKYKKMAATLGAKVASLQREMLEQRKELTVAVQAQVRPMKSMIMNCMRIQY